MLEIGSLIDGKYKILNKIGQGGMSTVYLAINERANKPWAIKEVRKDSKKDVSVVKQGIMTELKLLKKLHHPNLPTIVDVVDGEETFLIVMDYIEGNPLSQILEEEGAREEEQVIQWAKILCDILGYLHSQNPPIIYRDMKPDNIMLCPNGDIMMIDFGIARELKEENLEDTTCLGTIGYAAPEQFGGNGQTDTRTDIYNFGMTLYHLITGKNPSKPPYEILPIRRLNPKLSSGLECIIQKCIQKNPEKRYQCVAELMYDLNHYKEIDDAYRSKQKRKVIYFVLSILVTFMIGIISILASILGESNKNEVYERLLRNASSIEEYYNVILIDTGKIEGYLQLVQFLLRDGQLEEQEMLSLRKLLIGIERVEEDEQLMLVFPLEELKESNEKASEQVFYTIGEACLFNYNISVEKDRYENAAIWFKQAIKSYPTAKIYCDMSQCLNKIYQYTTSKIKQTEKRARQYEMLWIEIKNLISVSKQFGEVDNKFQVNQLIINMINNNIEDFVSIIGEQSVMEVVNTIKNQHNQVDFSILKEEIEKLDNVIEEIIQKIQLLERIGR